MTHLPVANLLGALVEDNLIARFAPMATCGQQVGERLDQSNGPERWTRMDSIHVHTYVYIYICIHIYIYITTYIYVYIYITIYIYKYYNIYISIYIYYNIYIYIYKCIYPPQFYAFLIAQPETGNRGSNYVSFCHFHLYIYFHEIIVCISIVVIAHSINFIQIFIGIFIWFHGFYPVH